MGAAGSLWRGGVDYYIFVFGLALFSVGGGRLRLLSVVVGLDSVFFSFTIPFS